MRRFNYNSASQVCAVFFSFAFLISPASAQAAPYWQSLYRYYDLHTNGAPSGYGWPVSRECCSEGVVFGAGDGAGPTNQFPNAWLPSYLSASAPNVPGQNAVTRYQVRGVSYSGYRMNYASQVDKVGSIAVPPGTEVRLDWACQDAQIGYVSFNGSCKAYDAFDNCIAYNGGGSIGFYVYDYRNPIGQGFSTGGKLVGTATVHPIQQTTYTLTCNPAWAGHVEGDPLQRTRLGNQAYFGTLLPAATFSLTVNILCPTPIEDAPNNSSGYWLKRSTTRWLNNSLLGFNQCLQNISGNDYYIPAKTKPELQSFFTNASANKVPGVTVF